MEIIKKLGYAFMLILLLGLAACNNSDSNKEMELTETNEPVVFENERVVPFSIELPDDYGFNLNEQAIFSIQEDGFPTLYFSIVQPNEGENLSDIVDSEKDFQEKLCEEESKCPKISKGVEMEINDYETLFYAIKYPSQKPETEGEFVYNYHYNFNHEGYFIQFWAYAPESKNPEKAKAQLDKIISSIEFKEIPHIIIQPDSGEEEGNLPSIPEQETEVDSPTEF